MPTVAKFPAYSTTEGDWEPIAPYVPIPDEDIISGSWASGSIHWIRADDSRDVDLPLQSCVSYHPEEVTFRVNIHGDEFIYVIEGEFTIDLDDGRSFSFQAGDAVHFGAGLSGVWTYKAGFRQFVNIVYVLGGSADRTEVFPRP